MWRIWAIFTLIVCFFILITTRLFHWQVVESGRLKTEASEQHFLNFTLPAQRGSIISNDGYPLVLNTTAYIVYAEPKKIQKITDFSRQVGEIIDMNAASLSAMLEEPNRMWVLLRRKADSETVDRLKTLHLTGLGFEKESKRYYPEASMSAHVIGIVGSDQNGDDQGYFGIEGFYDRELRGKNGYLSVEKDITGAPILIGEAIRIDPEDGRTLHLWIDRTVQNIVERKLEHAVNSYQAKEGSVIVMDPKTGGIIAMATYPNYNPGNFRIVDKDTLKNPNVASSYEPGSTFKTLIMASAIDNHLVTAASTMNEEGPVTIGDYTIRTWNNQYHGMITMTQILEYSSNVGMVYVAQKLGKEKLIRSIYDFGFGKSTNIDLEDEISPEIRSENEWKDIDLATVSFGQGIAVTPLQMAQAVAAIANGGILMEPHVVKEIQDSRGRTVRLAPKTLGRIVHPATAKIVAEMMVSAIDNGEARWTKTKGYRIAGKTGTAQIPVAGHYDEQKTITSFVGFAPADTPRFVMLVTMREPKTSPWGSETAAPLFFMIAKDLFLYYGIPSH